MTTYEITSSSPKKIITPLLRSKKIEVTNCTTNNITTNHNNSLNTYKYYTQFNEKDREKEKANSISRNYYNKLNNDNKKKNSNLQKRNFLWKQLDYEYELDINNTRSNKYDYNENNNEEYFHIPYYKTTNNKNEEYTKLKNERDNALSEIVSLKEINKSLRCDYADSMIKLKDYEKSNAELQKKIATFEEYKSETEQMEEVIDQYQIELNKLNEQIELLKSCNLQLENTNKKLMYDLREGSHRPMEGKKLKKSNSKANSTNSSNRNKRTKQEYANHNTSLTICQIEKENLEMNRKVDDIEQKISLYLLKNNVIAKQLNNSPNLLNENDKDSLTLIIQCLFAFVNSVNDIFQREHIFIEDYIKTGDIIKLTSVLDDIIQALSYILLPDKDKYDHENNKEQKDEDINHIKEDDCDGDGDKDIDII